MDQGSGGESLRIQAAWEPRSFTEPLDLLQDRVEAWIKAKEAKLESRQLGRGSNRYRARVGDYRMFYAFNLEQNKIHLLANGHRREIYRNS